MSENANKQNKPTQKPTIAPTTSNFAQQEEVPIEMIQRAIDTPSKETLTPSVVMTLQRRYGNHFTTNLVQRSKVIHRFTDEELRDVFERSYVEVMVMLGTNFDTFSPYLPENHPFTVENVKDYWKNGGGGAKDQIQKAAEEATLGEIPHFLRDVEKYKVSPSFSEGQRISNLYVNRHSSTETVNISDRNRRRIENFFSGPQNSRGRGIAQV